MLVNNTNTDYIIILFFPYNRHKTPPFVRCRSFVDLSRYWKCNGKL